ncbi:MAG TPA: hypothetical protein VHP83_08205 [Aggregatilineaceae bacterium]|nr:hypothetical protein [Aggregatilineaceae bacterium]
MSTDEVYLARREKQIKELYELRASSFACLTTGLILAGLSVGLYTLGYTTSSVILFVVSLLFNAGALFMFFSYFGQKAADRAIQQELYGHLLEKSKRQVTLFSDDGELLSEADTLLMARSSEMS